MTRRHPGRALRHGLIAILMMACVAAGTAASARAAALPDNQTVERLQAALLMNFARFVEWPPEAFTQASSAIVVAVVGDEGVAVALESAARGKAIAGRNIVVKRLQWDSDVSGVHMLFIGEAEKRRAAILLERVQRRQIVTVSSLSDFIRSGGMIALKFADGRVSFSVNSSATGLSGVHLSSFLLTHATKVSGEPGPAAR